MEDQSTRTRLLERIVQLQDEVRYYSHDGLDQKLMAIMANIEMVASDINQRNEAIGRYILNTLERLEAKLEHAESNRKVMIDTIKQRIENVEMNVSHIAEQMIVLECYPEDAIQQHQGPTIARGQMMEGSQIGDEDVEAETGDNYSHCGGNYYGEQHVHQPRSSASYVPDYHGDQHVGLSAEEVIQQPRSGHSKDDDQGISDEQDGNVPHLHDGANIRRSKRKTCCNIDYNESNDDWMPGSSSTQDMRLRRGAT